MAAFRSGNDALGTGKEHAGIEGFQLLDIHRLHIAVLHQLAQDNAGPVVTQTAGVDGRRLEAVAQGKHGKERGHAGLVAKVILEFSLGQLGAGVRFGRNEAGLLAVLDVVPHEREGQAAEVGAAAEAGNHDIRILAGQGHLLFGFQADDGLVQAHVVEHGAQGILAVRGAHGQFDGLGDGAAQGALVVGVAGDDVLTGTGTHGRGRRDGGAEGLHDGAAERLLLIAHLDHIDSAVYAEFLGGIAEGTAPLAGTGFSGEVGNALLLGIIGLGDGAVELMAAGGAHGFVLEVDVSGGAQGGFQFIGSHQRGAAVGGVLLAYFFGDGDPFVGLVQFLVGAGLAEDGIQVFGFEGLPGGRVQERQRLVGHDGLDVKVVGRDLTVREDVLFLFHTAKCFMFLMVLFTIE